MKGFNRLERCDSLIENRINISYHKKTLKKKKDLRI